MRVQQIKIDWVDILLDWTFWIFYSKTNYTRMDTDDESENFSWSHWRYTSPLYARTRRISLEWYIDNLWNVKEEEAYNHLTKMFALQSQPVQVMPKVLYIKDIHWKEWIMNVKVADPLDIQETDDDFWDYAREWRIELESVEDPRYYSAQEVTQNVLELDYGWFTMDFELWFSMDEYTNVMILTTGWNVDAPIRFVIDVISDFEGPFTIRDLWTWKQMQFDIDWVIGDRIIVDTGLYKATKNNINIIWFRIPGSERLSIKWESTFGIMSKDWWLNHNDFDINVFYRDVLL